MVAVTRAEGVQAPGRATSPEPQGLRVPRRLPGLAIAVGAIGLVMYVAHTAAGIGGRGTTILLLALTLAAAVVACGAAALEDSRTRIAWALLTVAVAGYGVTALSHVIVADGPRAFRLPTTWGC